MRPGTVRLLLSTVLLLFGCALREARSEDIFRTHTYKLENRVSFLNATAFHFGMRSLNLGTTYWSESHGATESAPGLRTDRLPKTAGLALAYALVDTASQRWAPKWVTRFERVIHALYTAYGMFMDIRAGRQAQAHGGAR